MSIIVPDMTMPEDCRDCPMEMYYMNIGETLCRAANKIWRITIKLFLLMAGQIGVLLMRWMNDRQRDK